MQDIANQIKTLVEHWCINGRNWNTHPIAIVSQAVQDYAGSKESRGAISMQGDEAGEFIDEIDSLYDQLQTIDKDTIALALARDYIENLWD